MAQTIQIVPKHSFPYVETVVNDYTLVGDSYIADVSSDDSVRYIYPFVSSKGIDNRFIRKRTRAEIVSAYGETNWKKYGQPLMQALEAASATNTEVWCMRVMPEDAAYAHNIISAYYRADSSTDVVKASERRFRIKYVPKTSTTPVVTVKELLEKATELDGTAIDGVYVDGEGYTQIPGVITLYSAGRGKYGNNYRVRINQELYYEKDHGIKYYNFEVMSTEAGLTKEANYVGAVVTSSKYNQVTLINDILEDVAEGVVPVFINVDEAGIEDLYNAYVEWAQALIVDLEAELEVAEDEESAAAITALISEASNIPALDEFDAILGRRVGSINKLGLVEIAGESPDSDVIAWDSVTGAKLSAGSDGIFETSPETAIEECYKNAFSGVYDKRVLTPKRIKANALFDANYPMSVKKTMADLAVLRNDALCYLDCGIMSSFSTPELKNLIDDYSVFDNHKISKNVHHYYIKESTTKKRIPVTITYFLSRKYADHVMNFGFHIPFVKSYAQLSGHVKDSLSPSVEDFELELKETLTENKFNFFETVDDNVYQRATQNTSQMVNTDLLEENNVTTLYTIKRIVEADITAELYDFSNAESRQRFRTIEKAKFADWNNREVQSFDIDFRMTPWEAERSILHAYIDVTFRGLQKRAILEIDVNKREPVTENEV
jgi:hypothetical protein